MQSMMKYLGLLILAAAAVFTASACGQEESAGDMVLDNENWESVNLADKDQPSVLFHFTGVN
ncbi:hypothetical protein [Salibacterium halotolerans]|uniref:AhpC/TSA family protein n=1 Tax=Salibacterium halotolerans TaxID=1884432 RepID=A0A1I5T777_9BACI|nr:hypothetical protein [Salibacterium halotolerans]SFP78914.1 hypothetical protein SAMN05518683_11040 [Salibacterium halotolerans]